MSQAAVDKSRTAGSGAWMRRCFQSLSIPDDGKEAGVLWKLSILDLKDHGT